MRSRRRARKEVSILISTLFSRPSTEVGRSFWLLFLLLQLLLLLLLPPCRNGWSLRHALLRGFYTNTNDALRSRRSFDFLLIRLGYQLFTGVASSTVPFHAFGMVVVVRLGFATQ